MASSSSKDQSIDGSLGVSGEDIAKAFNEIARGERTAAALEESLTSLEKKIDDLLDSFGESERRKVEGVKNESSRDQGDNVNN